MVFWEKVKFLLQIYIQLDAHTPTFAGQPKQKVMWPINHITI